MRLVACLACLALAACATAPVEGPGLSSVRFGQAILPTGVARSNADLAADFLDLTFELESGEKLDHLIRYETPVRVYLRSPELAAYRPDLTALLARLRAEAGIDIAETDDPEAAQIVIEAVPSAQIAKVFPSAACFIVPGESDWKGFMRRKPDVRVRWPDQKALERAAIFLPLDTTPQDVRDCLHEEITQALGPAERPLPAARLDLERRQLPRHGDTLRHDDPARALPARAEERHDARGGGGRPPQGPRPRQPAGPRLSRARRARPSRGPGPRRSRPRSTATRRAAGGSRRRRSRPRSPPRCAPSTIASGSRS